MRVLDLSRLLPGPYCSRIQADFGAEVIKVDRPGVGDRLRHVQPIDPQSGDGLLYRHLSRGKKSLTLGLKRDEGQEVFLRLVPRTDVLLETFHPGVMQRLGLDYETLAALNPGLVYCALTGFGPA